MHGLEWMAVYIALGSFVGFMAGLVGAGGGGILVPMLTSIFAYQGIGGNHAVHLALGTSLTCMIVSSTASLRAHSEQGTVEWRIVAAMAPGIILGALATTQVAAELKASSISLFFSTLMALVAWQLFSGWSPMPSTKPLSLPGLVGIGMGIGSISALAAVGGGFLTIAYLGYKNVDLKKAIGTSAAIGFPIAIAGTAGYLIGGWTETRDVPNTLGFIHLPAFFGISTASAAAARFGARYSQGLPDRFLKRLLAIIALALSVKMLISFVEF